MIPAGSEALGQIEESKHTIVNPRDPTNDASVCPAVLISLVKTSVRK